MQMYYVKTEVLIPIDPGGNPEAAGIARTVIKAECYRSYTFHHPGPVDADFIRILRDFIRTWFISPEPGKLPPLLQEMLDGPNALVVCGIEFSARPIREADDDSPASWMVYGSWRK